MSIQVMNNYKLNNQQVLLLIDVLTEHYEKRVSKLNEKIIEDVLVELNKDIEIEELKGEIIF